MEEYELKISKKEFLGILSDYYTLKLEKPIKVKEKHYIASVGYYETKEVVVEIYYQEQIEILGHLATKTTTITKEELKEILNQLMNNENYVVKDLNYETGTEYEGYRMCETQVPYFNGVTLKIIEKQKKLRK